ncbi:hypothetical protein ANANG_G00055810 [Anguilla anguilla]|uniref:AF4/FMR2 C-terminal homology domain-containing protein n=1 Tax=Anguilla anguilla TaxID=7936 RepID=A0A9D3S6G2_ANGAN|nr:hypothetical protein ANANG_G00055810 [Anguilla anguilla]
MKGLLLELRLTIFRAVGHYEQDRSALKKKEWERRTQEVPRDEDLFSSGFNLFGEPYKTNKGDALANRVQNTLGNYDEMKELLTNHSNQSHLVGIPKSSAPQTPMEKQPDQPSFFPEGQRGRTAPAQQGSAPMPPPQSSSGATALAAASRGPGGGSVRAGEHGTSAHEQPQGAAGGPVQRPGGGGAQGDSSPVPAASSSHGRRHGQASKAPPSADHAYKEGGHAKSPADQDLGAPRVRVPRGLHVAAPQRPVHAHLPQGLHCKPSAVQQKPTAYVRPMDGQDQVPNDSPELKPPVEIGDGYGGAPFAALLDGKAAAPAPRASCPS